MKTSNALCGLLSGLLLLAAGTAHAADLLRDEFDDGNIATNTTGVGSGWTTTTINYGVTATENNGLVTLSGSSTVKGIRSNDVFDPIGKTLTWKIRSRPTGGANGVNVGWTRPGGFAGCCDLGVFLEMRNDRVVFDIMNDPNFQPAFRQLTIPLVAQNSQVEG